VGGGASTGYVMYLLCTGGGRGWGGGKYVIYFYAPEGEVSRLFWSQIAHASLVAVSGRVSDII
jgi:hypothetical protein